MLCVPALEGATDWEAENELPLHDRLVTNIMARPRSLPTNHWAGGDDCVSVRSFEVSISDGYRMVKKLFGLEG